MYIKKRSAFPKDNTANSTNWYCIALADEFRLWQMSLDCIAIILSRQAWNMTSAIRCLSFIFFALTNQSFEHIFIGLIILPDCCNAVCCHQCLDLLVPILTLWGLWNTLIIIALSVWIRILTWFLPLTNVSEEFCIWACLFCLLLSSTTCITQTLDLLQLQC